MFLDVPLTSNCRCLLFLVTVCKFSRRQRTKSAITDSPFRKRPSDLSSRISGPCLPHFQSGGFSCEKVPSNRPLQS